MAKIVARSGTNIFDSMLGDIDYPRDGDVGKLYPFKVRCGVVKNRAPRHEFFEYIVDMGKPDIERVLKHQPLRYNVPMDLTFVFPERWMAVKEQTEFMHALATHPDVGKIRSVDILTSSPVIITDFMKEQVRVLTWPEDGHAK